jgi:hypothetical protein
MSKKPAATLAAILFAVIAPDTMAASTKGGRPAAQLTPAAAVAGHCAAWNTIDHADRDSLLDRVFTRDGVYSDATPTYVTGRAALSDAIARFQRQYPGARFRCSAPQTHHRAMRVSWLLVGADGKVVTQGMDFYELAPNGLIRRVTGFFGPPPALDASR